MGVFSRFLSCTNGIKSRNASHMYNIYPKIKPATSTTLNIRIVRQKHKIIATLSMSFGESARSLQTVVFLTILKNLQ